MSKYQVGESLYIDVTNRVVHHNDMVIKLPELSYRLLVTLVEHAPNIVSHDQLIEAVWQNRVVSDENLKKRVSRLREVLGESFETAQYVVAERGMGYRCAAKVTELSDHQVAKIPVKSAKNISSVKMLSDNGLKLLFGLVIVVGLYLSSFYLFLTDSNNQVSGEASDYLFQAQQYGQQFNVEANARAISWYHKALAADEQLTAVYSGLADSYAYGYFAFGGDEIWLQQALLYSQKAQQVEPEQALSFKSRGFALYLSGHYLQAEHTYKKAIELAPNWGELWAQLALVYLAQGEVIMAYTKARQGVEKDPGNPFTLAVLGYSYRELSMPHRARQALANALKLNPEYELANSYLAELSMSEGDVEQAISILTEQINRAPKFQLAHWLLGQCYLFSGRVSLARKSFKQAALLGGRYALPANIYVAVINQHEQLDIDLTTKLEQQLMQGNQWPELLYSKGMLLLQASQTEAAFDVFHQTLDKGIKQHYRFIDVPLFSALTDDNRYQALLVALARKNHQQRLKRVPRKSAE